MLSHYTVPRDLLPFTILIGRRKSARFRPTLFPPFLSRPRTRRRHTVSSNVVFMRHTSNGLAVGRPFQTHSPSPFAIPLLRSFAHSSHSSTCNTFPYLLAHPLDATLLIGRRALGRFRPAILPPVIHLLVQSFVYLSCSPWGHCPPISSHLFSVNRGSDWSTSAHLLPNRSSVHPRPRQFTSPPHSPAYLLCSR